MTRRHWYFAAASMLSLLAMIFCYSVYQAGQFGSLEIGADYLSGIPNYYFFYTIVLPFVAAGVIFLARENVYIRLLGDLSEDLGIEGRRKVLKFRRVLLVVAVLFSALITLQDAADKTTALPPYSIDLDDPAANERLARFFACERNWRVDDCGAVHANAVKLEKYLDELKTLGYSGQSPSGFDSFAHWRAQASSVYVFESLLSFFAALIVGLLLVEVFLLIMVKDFVRPATKSLVVWMLVLVSLWFPTKMYSSWHSHLGERTTPTILWFGVVLLILGILLVVFLKTERNDLYKFASVVTAIFSALVAGVSVFKPEVMEQAIAILADAGLIYTSILALLLMFSLYLVTDHFIGNYERETRA